MSNPSIMPHFGAIIAGTGSYVPEGRITNDDLSQLVDTSDEWITQRTGIKERRVAAKDETTASMGSIAARRALEAAGITAQELDLIVCATITPEMQFPSTACFIAAALGLNSTPAFDVTAACSGFIYALEVGANFVKTGRYRNVLVVGSETLTRVTDYTDRASCILFGDGAGAVVLQKSSDIQRGVIHSSLYADGHGWEMLYCPPGSRHPISGDLVAERRQYMQIKGREVYKFAVARFSELIAEALRRCELRPEDVRLVVPHQVNKRIIDSALDKVTIPSDKCFVNIARYGNTSAASVPIALDEAWRSGHIRKGDVIILVAFGAGLTWGNAVIRA
jgi:3-oxoacyl-[acyl-carrier-protein] synthase III